MPACFNNVAAGGGIIVSKRRTIRNAAAVARRAAILARGHFATRRSVDVPHPSNPPFRDRCAANDSLLAQQSMGNIIIYFYLQNLQTGPNDAACNCLHICMKLESFKIHVLQSYDKLK